MGQPAIFLDRDGVINRNRPDHVKRWSDFEFLPGSLAAMTELARLGWPIVVITNQAAIGRGLASAQDVAEINRQMQAAVAGAGGRIDAVLVCPHRPEEHCACRKPQLGLLRQAAELLDLDLMQSYLVGDAASDIQVALAAGCYPLLVRSGRGLAQKLILEDLGVHGFAVVDDLAGAACWLNQRIAGHISMKTEAYI